MFELVPFDHGLAQAVAAMLRSGFYSTDDIAEFFHEIATDDPDAELSPDTVDEDVHKIATTAMAALTREAAGLRGSNSSGGLLPA